MVLGSLFSFGRPAGAETGRRQRQSGAAGGAAGGAAAVAGGSFDNLGDNCVLWPAEELKRRNNALVKKIKKRLGGSDSDQFGNFKRISIGECRDADA